MKNTIIVAAFIFGLFISFGVIQANDPAVQEKRTAERVIDACWKDQARKSLEPGTARYVAGMCEELEQRYMTKYGHKP